jgi:hypothetical protein
LCQIVRTNAVFLHVVTHRPPKKTPKFRAVVSVLFRNENCQAVRRTSRIFSWSKASRTHATLLWLNRKQQPKAFMSKDDVPRTAVVRSDWPYLRGNWATQPNAISERKSRNFCVWAIPPTLELWAPATFPIRDCRVDAELGSRPLKKRPRARPLRTRRSALQPCEITCVAFGAIAFVRPANF